MAAGLTMEDLALQHGELLPQRAALALVNVVNITAAGDFPWMMPQWKDVTASMSNLALSPTGKRIAVEADGSVGDIERLA